MTNKQFSGFIRYGPIYNSTQRELNELVLTEILTLSDQIEFPLGVYGISKPLINIITYPYDKTELQVLIENGTFIERFDYKKNKPSVLHLQLNIDVPTEVPVKIENILKESLGIDDIYGTLSHIDVNTFMLQDFFEKCIYDFVLAINLANPGSLPIKYGFISVDEQKVKDLKVMPNDVLFAAKQMATKITWPLIQNLDIRKTWEWLLTHKDFVGGSSQSPTERGINSFGNLFTTEYSVSLFWAIVGIEAFYTKGHGDLQNQVREKSELVLGTQDSFKKAFNSMYNFRSRFVHGDLNYPGTMATVESISDTEGYYTELYNSTHFATAILTSTIQYLIAKNWSGFNFTYSVSNF